MRTTNRCPQCGATEEFAEYCHMPNSFDLIRMVCHLCGYNEILPEMHDILPEGVQEGPDGYFIAGVGVKFLTYDPEAGLGGGIIEFFRKDVVYDKEKADYEQLNSFGVLIPEYSYITRAEGADVVFLRGDIDCGRNHYMRFVRMHDEMIRKAGLRPPIDVPQL